MANHDMPQIADRDVPPPCGCRASQAHAEQLHTRLDALNRAWPPPPAPVVVVSRQDRTIAGHRSAVAAAALLGVVGIITATAGLDRLAGSLWANVETRGATVMTRLLDISVPAHLPKRPNR